MGFQINSKCVLRAWIGVYFMTPGQDLTMIRLAKLSYGSSQLTGYCHELSCCKVILMRRVTQQLSYDHELSSVMLALWGKCQGDSTSTISTNTSG